MRVGLKHRFSEVREHFFMKMAVDGPSEFVGTNAAQEIMDKSYVFYVKPSMKECIKIGKNEKFKHHSFKTEDGGIHIEYFAFCDREYLLDDVKKDKGAHCDGVSISGCFSAQKEMFDEFENENKKVGVINIASIILIAEKSNTFKLEPYSVVIKHELGHICLNEIEKNMGEDGTGYNAMRTPAIWTDEQLVEWMSDLRYLYEFFKMDTEDAKYFTEFIAEFLMFESDGQTREANPIKESRVPRSTNPNAKPKVTYRTLSPIDRFEEWVDGMIENQFKSSFEKIIDSLRESYVEYDKFLDSIKMN